MKNEGIYMDNKEVKNDVVKEYKETLDGVFGEGACAVLKVRKYGGIKVL